MKILLIGGTADGRHLATQLHELGFDVTYSIAGLVRKAALPCLVISGGFTQFGGLAQYVSEHGITHLLDVTHPFAQKMSHKITQVSAQLNLPALRFHRLPWAKTAADKWVEVESWAQLMGQLKRPQSVFITAGQISQSVLDKLARLSSHILIRTAMPLKIDLPSINLPRNVTWLKAIGPFQLNNEKALIKHYKIDLMVSKNSGGEATYAKIIAAAEAGITVYQFKRPLLQPSTYQFDSYQGCIDCLIDLRENNDL